MNLAATISIYSGGPGSGCVGPNCGRKTLYHVTYTSLVPKIQKEGLRPMQTSNWVKSGDKSRFGSGEVHIFTNEDDAKRWAGKMDWMFNHELGTGKISILKVEQGNERWKEDTGDPLGRAMSKGTWLKYMGHVPPERIGEAERFTREDAKQLV